MKKGTGSELMADHATEKRSRRGACPLFPGRSEPSRRAGISRCPIHPGVLPFGTTVSCCRRDGWETDVSSEICSSARVSVPRTCPITPLRSAPGAVPVPFFRRPPIHNPQSAIRNRLTPPKIAPGEVPVPFFDLEGNGWMDGHPCGMVECRK